MCQLSLCDCRDESLNRLLVYILATENSRISHQDGFGFFTGEGRIWKTRLGAANVTNLGEILRTYSFKNKTIFHVRQASDRTKQPTDAKAHPFQTKDLVLVHNGTLIYEGKDILPPDLIDSEQFLSVLQKNYTKLKNISKAVEETYKDFSGKFAFIIYEKPTKKYYIVRGRATLFQGNFKIIREGGITEKGVVFNTERLDLVAAMLRFKNLAEMLYSVLIEFTPEKDIDLLTENTIYLLNNDDILEKVGEVKEKAIAVATDAWGKVCHREYVDTLYENITKFCGITDLTLWELDKLVFVTMQKPLITCNRDDLVDFDGLVIRALNEKISVVCTKRRINLWEKVCEKHGFDYDKIYENIQFPWFMNDNKTLATLYNK